MNIAISSLELSSEDRSQFLFALRRHRRHVLPVDKSTRWKTVTSSRTPNSDSIGDQSDFEDSIMEYNKETTLRICNV